jgi:carboxyl-terminal processing protease
MSSADSIHFPDSLRYSTMLKKRTVYGGGGIMPDVFVPVDTTRYTDLHRELVNKGILNRFTLTYVDDNRQALLDKYKNSQEFIRQFQFDDELLEELFKLAIKDNVNITEERRQEDLSLLRLQCKAYIARDLFKSADYYKVMAPMNESLQEALRILGDKKLRARYGLL